MIKVENKRVQGAACQHGMRARAAAFQQATRDCREAIPKACPNRDRSLRPVNGHMSAGRPCAAAATELWLPKDRRLSMTPNSSAS